LPSGAESDFEAAVKRRGDPPQHGERMASVICILEA
jgi:hypothetical protein